VAAGLIGVVIGATSSEPLDLAVAVARGWHVTVFVPGTAGVLLLFAGAAMLMVAVIRARRSARGPQAN